MCQSTFFKRVFGAERKSEVTIEGIDATTMKTLVEFVYRGAGLVDISARLFELYEAALKLGVETLRVGWSLDRVEGKRIIAGKVR